jgi:hypothetical protein
MVGASTGSVTRSTRGSGRGRKKANLTVVGGGGLDPSAQADMDHLLDKVGAGGLDSLTRAERKRLDGYSKKLRAR